jgi:hypothetical protein
MLTLATRINIYSSSQRLTRSLLSSSSTLSNTRQYHSGESQTEFSHYLINLHSWKLTHQPYEPNLHWNPRFRQQQQKIEIEEDQSTENWDSWFQQPPAPPLIPFSQRNNLFSQDQLYFLDPSHYTPMPKRRRESQTPSPFIEQPNKREKYHHCKF